MLPQDTTTTTWNTRHTAWLIGVLAVQFIAAYIIGSQHLLANVNFSPLPPIAMTALVPVGLFMATYALSESFRRLILGVDLRLLTMLHLWRVLGFTFLILLTLDHLPPLFAWPAGAGDVMVGIGAAFVTWRLFRDSGYALTPAFQRFHLLGLLDFAIAMGSAGLASGAFPALIPILETGAVTSAPMDVWPLNIFPSFGVPAFIITHLVVLLKLRDLRRQAGDHADQNLKGGSFEAA